MMMIFLIQDERWPIFTAGHKEQEERPRCKTFEQAYPPTELLVFL